MNLIPLSCVFYVVLVCYVYDFVRFWYGFRMAFVCFFAWLLFGLSVCFILLPIFGFYVV